MLPLDLLHTIGCHYNVEVHVLDPIGNMIGRYGVRSSAPIQLSIKDDHVTFIGYKGMVVRPIKTVERAAPALARNLKADILALPVGSHGQFTPSPSYASKYIREVIKGTTGTFHEEPISVDMLKAYDSYFDTTVAKPVDVVMFYGDPGCRKSSGLQKVLRQQKYKADRIYNVTCATNTLAKDWRDKLDVQAKDPLTKRGAPNTTVTTFEVTLAKGAWGWVMVFDEDKYPKGYLDALMLLFPWVTLWVFACDNLQSEWHEPEDRCQLNSPDIWGNARRWSSQIQGKKIIGTWRLAPDVAALFNLPTTSSSRGHIGFTTIMPTSWLQIKQIYPFLTDIDAQHMFANRDIYSPGDANKRWVASQHGYEADTYAGSQGLTAPLSIIQVTRSSWSLSDPRILYTVLTRSSYPVLYIESEPYGNDWNVIGQSKIWTALMRAYQAWQPGRRVRIPHGSRVDMFSLVPDNRDKENFEFLLCAPPEKITNWDDLGDAAPATVGHVDPDKPLTMVGRAKMSFKDEEYVDAYTFLPYIQELGFEEGVEPESFDSAPPDVRNKESIPPEPQSLVEEMLLQRAVARFDRELTHKRWYSMAHDDMPQRRADWVELGKQAAAATGVKAAKIWAEQAAKPLMERMDHYMPLFSYMGLREKKSDSVAAALAMKTRIRRSTIRENQQELKEASPYGSYLFTELCRYAGWDPSERKPYTHIDVERHTAIHQSRRAERPVALRNASRNRVEPDFHGMLTFKNQLKINSREMKHARPLQPILLQNEESLFKLGPFFDFMLESILKDLPPSCYVHAKRSIADMQAWVNQYMRAEQFQELDMSGFDGTVRGGAVHLTALLMRRYGAPEDMISYYLNLKCSYHVNNRWVFGLMTLSGEQSTYFTNTFFELAREIGKYRLTPQIPIAVSGDDLLRPATSHVVSPEWLVFKDVDFCIEKRTVVTTGAFCSYMVRNGVLAKDPVILLQRTLAMLEAGKAEDILLGYAEHWRLNYLNIEHIMQNQIWGEEEFACHKLMTFMMMNPGKFGFHKRLKYDKLHLVPSDYRYELAEMPATLLQAMSDVFTTTVVPLREPEVIAQYTRRQVDLPYHHDD